MRVYVSTNAKYAAGSLKGKWLDLKDYVDRDGFIEACLELHNDESNPELMFQDKEGIPDCLCSESRIEEEVWEILELDRDMQEAAIVFCDWQGGWDKYDFKDSYDGQYSSPEQWAREFLDDVGLFHKVDDRLEFYFDFKRFARDEMVNRMYYDEETGHMFRRF